MLPNFLVVGAARSGTTSLYNYLKEHPEIYMSPVKEPRFFSFINMKPAFKGPFDRRVNKDIITNLADYEKLFKGASFKKRIGECSCCYLYFPETAANIKKYIPECRIIIILRNPVERAFSHYLQMVMLGHENLGFEEALEKEEERLRMNWRWSYQYTGQGMYYNRVKRYLDIFGQNRVKVYLFEELKDNPLNLVKSIYNFLAVDSSFVPSLKKPYNVSGLPKNITLHKFLRHSNFIKKITKPFTPKKVRGKIFNLIARLNYDYKNRPSMEENTRKYLQGVFKENILKLQDLIQRDLSAWLK